VQTWLFTGLFITGHDSMHGTICRNRALNNFLGFLATTLYSGLWYPTLKKKHYLHHIHVGTGKDPDYHTGNQNFFIWWFSFMKQYLTIWQLLIMAAIFNAGLLFFNELQLIVLWIVPSVLSTFQLFFFGTYLPHHLPHTIEMEPHKARSQRRNHVWAMLSCYFFGYHFEHHESPQTPWWMLYRLKGP
jgi:beta-carotene ketolase (CrtW type)